MRVGGGRRSNQAAMAEAPVLRAGALTEAKAGNLSMGEEAGGQASKQANGRPGNPGPTGQAEM